MIRFLPHCPHPSDLVESRKGWLYHRMQAMLMYLLSRVLTLLTIFWLLRLLLRTILEWKSPTRARKSATAVPIAGELKKDPNCGTYVSMETALKSRVGARELHFCSRRCQEEYLRAARKDSA